MRGKQNRVSQSGAIGRSEMYRLEVFEMRIVQNNIED